MFRVVVTYGVPLDTTVQFLYDNNLLIDWIEFLESSIKEGWNLKSTLVKIETSLIDIRGKEYTDDVVLRLKYYISKRNSLGC